MFPKYVSIEGVAINYFHPGASPLPDTAPPLDCGELLLFLHGIGNNRTSWHLQLPHFASHFTAAAWDARGYGDSDDYEGPLDFHSYGDDVVRVLDHFGVKRAHIVGLSMGGRIAMDLAARYPQLCDPAILRVPGLGSLPSLGDARPLDMTAESLGAFRVEVGRGLARCRGRFDDAVWTPERMAAVEAASERMADVPPRLLPRATVVARS